MKCSEFPISSISVLHFVSRSVVSFQLTLVLKRSHNTQLSSLIILLS
jgi:hypothetical protein